MKQEAIKKITDSMQNCNEKNVPAEPIAEFLKGKCSEDEKFATLVMQEHKMLDKCFSFVYEQAKKHLNSSSGWIEDNEVYMMAVDYFSLDDAELEQKKAEEEKRREEERRKREEERKQKEADIKEQKTREAKQKAADKKIPEGQLSLI